MKTVTDLTRDELTELKGFYLTELVNEGEIEEPSWWDLANIDEIVSDEIVFEYYHDILFTEDDFFCNMNDERNESK